jgi:hypothetical protein
MKLKRSIEYELTELEVKNYIDAKTDQMLDEILNLFPLIDEVDLSLQIDYAEAETT